MDELPARLRARYGAAPPPVQGETNPALDVLLSHKSVRHFLPEVLPEASLEKIIAAAQSAATSSNLQTWSVIALQNEEQKANASVLCGDQKFIRDAPLFLVFCADLSRLTEISERANLPGEGLRYLELFLMAAIDASLAAQNAAIAAESLGLGICYVGGARNQPRELARLLKFPPRVFAVFGMAVGRPAPGDPSSVKPRLPLSEILHHETYSPEHRVETIARYNETMQTFYREQGMKVEGDWSRHSAKRVAAIEALTGRHLLREILLDFGFELN